MQNFFQNASEEKSFPDCGEFGIIQAGMEKLLCILQFIILNLSDLGLVVIQISLGSCFLGIKKENIYDAN